MGEVIRLIYVWQLIKHKQHPEYYEPWIDWLLERIDSEYWNEEMKYR